MSKVHSMPPRLMDTRSVRALGDSHTSRAGDSYEAVQWEENASGATLPQQNQAQVECSLENYLQS